jgi:hypothetical protein
MSIPKYKIWNSHGTRYPNYCQDEEGDWHKVEDVNILNRNHEAALAAKDAEIARLRAAVEAAAKLPCPRDTNGDGDCGRVNCPWCGKNGLKAALQPPTPGEEKK